MDFTARKPKGVTEANKEGSNREEERSAAPKTTISSSDGSSSSSSSSSNTLDTNAIDCESAAATTTPAATTSDILHPTYTTRDKNPWLSISDALIGNKCWICETPFQRGYRKKVFMISQLIAYLVHRRDEISPSINLSSHNLRSWYMAFVEDLGGNETQLEEILKEKNVTLWFSGLVCCQNEWCLEQYQLIIPPSEDEAATAAKALDSIRGKLAANCPPGCMCDNPWPFLSS